MPPHLGRPQENRGDGIDSGERAAGSPRAMWDPTSALASHYLTILRQQHEGYCDPADCVLASKINAMRALMSDLARVALTSNFGAVEETQPNDDAAISHEAAAG
jgi:hypothetical protein